MAEVFRQPLVTRRAVPDASRAVRSQAEVGRSQAIYLGVGAPLRPRLFENPRGARRQHFDAISRNIAALQPTTAPARGLVLDLPQRPKPSFNNLTWTQSPAQSPVTDIPPATWVGNLHIVNRWPAIGAQGWLRNIPLLQPQANPFAQLDWPNPRGPQRGRMSGEWRSFIALLHSIKPASQTDWPNPRAPQRGIFAYEARNIPNLQPTSAPFAPVAWPNPRGPQWPVELRTWVQGVSLANQFARPVGVESYEYQRLLRPEAFRTETSGRNVAALTPTGDPFVQDQQFVPRWPKPDRSWLFAWYGGRNLATATAPSGTPFAPIYTVPMWQRPAPRFDAPPPNVQALISTLPTISVLPPYIVVYFWKRVS